MKHAHWLLVMLIIPHFAQAEIAAPWESFIYINDKNNDGKLNLTEFLHADTTHFTFDKPLTRETFCELDTNRNGYIEWLRRNKRQDKYCDCVGFKKMPEIKPWE